MGDAAPDIEAALSECGYQSSSHPHSPKFLEPDLGRQSSFTSLFQESVGGFQELCLGSGSSFCTTYEDGSPFPAALSFTHTTLESKLLFSGHILSRKCLQ